MCKFVGAKELAEMLAVSESKAYSYIRTMNEELQKQNYLIVRGKVPRAYVEKRFFTGGTEAAANAKP